MKNELGSTTTVAQLIEALRKFPPEMRVIVRGYESGYDDPERLVVIQVEPEDFESTVYGQYKNAVKDMPQFSAVLIDRP